MIFIVISVTRVLHRDSSMMIIVFCFFGFEDFFCFSNFVVWLLLSETMEDWDQETLEKVVESKKSDYNQNKATDIVCFVRFVGLGILTIESICLVFIYSFLWLIVRLLLDVWWYCIIFKLFL